MSGSDADTGKKYTNADLESMSDEEIINLRPEQMASEPTSNSMEYEHTESSGEPDDNNDPEELVSEDDDDDSTESDDDSEQQDSDADSDDEDLDAGENEPDGSGHDDSDGTAGGSDDAVDSDEDKSSGDSGDTDSTKPDSKEAGSEKQIDYEAEYKALLQPFKANGRNMQVNNVEEAKQLMQMGANYNKKMQGLAPHLKVVRSLEKAGITDEAQINYLIDLHNKDPKAINKLVSDSGIEPLDLDKEAGKQYVPNDNSISDTENRIKQVMDEISDTESYPRTLQILGKQWDSSSKDIVGSQPELMKTINDHVADGVYDLIDTEVTRQRALGQLQGLSDIDAYKQVGDQIEAQGGFNELPAIKAKREAMQSSPTTAPVAPKRNVEDPKRKQKRRAAGSTRKPASKAQEQFNPLNLSDDEFMKQFGT